jgi:hypothetical protein
MGYGYVSENKAVNYNLLAQLSVQICPYFYCRKLGLKVGHFLKIISANVYMGFGGY